FGERGHIAVEFVVRKLPLGGERVVSVLVQLVVLAFAVIVLVWGGWRASQNAWLQNLSALPFTLGQMYLALPISGALIAFYSLYYIQAVARNTQLPYGDHSDEDELVPATTVEPEPRGLDEVDSILLDPDETERRGDDPAGPKTEACWTRQPWQGSPCSSSSSSGSSSRCRSPSSSARRPSSPRSRSWAWSRRCSSPPSGCSPESTPSRCSPSPCSSWPASS